MTESFTQWGVILFVASLGGAIVRYLYQRVEGLRTEMEHVVAEQLAKIFLQIEKSQARSDLQLERIQKDINDDRKETANVRLEVAKTMGDLVTKAEFNRQIDRLLSATRPIVTGNGNGR